MTVGAARGIRKVLHAVGVAAQARVALGARSGLAVAGVTAPALLMLRFGVEPGKRARLMAARARRRPRNAVRTVSAVAVRAAGHAPAVRGARFRRVTARAARGRNGTGVRLMTAPAVLVTRGRARLLRCVTALAGDPGPPAVWLVAARATFVTSMHRGTLGRVARVATERGRARAMR